MPVHKINYQQTSIIKPQVKFLLNNGQINFYPGSVVAGFITFDLSEYLTSVEGNLLFELKHLITIVDTI